MVAHERVDIAVLFRLPLHELQRADRRRATVDIVAEKDEQIVRVVKRNPCPETFEAVRLPVHITDRENPTKHPTAPPLLHHASLLYRKNHENDMIIYRTRKHRGHTLTFVPWRYMIV